MDEDTSYLAGHKHKKPDPRDSQSDPIRTPQLQQIIRCAVGSAMVSFAFSRIGLTIFLFILGGMSNRFFLVAPVGLSLELTI